VHVGFPINGEDGKGNTLLIIACQNSNKRMVEMLVARGANVNHQNAVGNTALHYCMSFDPEGQIGSYLISHGADDSIENIEGLTPYDGLGSAGGNY
jgi:ankyrin repeat protein